MKFIGADLHKKTITFCVLEEARGRKLQLVTRRRLSCANTAGIQTFLQELGPCELVVEATIGFDWFAALAEQVCSRVVIAHPARDKLTRRATSIRNTIRGILTRYNADRTDLFTRTGWKAALELDLHDAERWVLEELKDEWDQVKVRLKRADQRLEQFAASAPLAEREARAVLASMPGIGPVTIEVILAVLGDWRRFKNADAVAAFAGLDPGVWSSDDRRYNLKLTKAGSPLLRWILIQLAHRLKRRTARWSRIYAKLQRRLGNKNVPSPDGYY
jgi:transposase